MALKFSIISCLSGTAKLAMTVLTLPNPQKAQSKMTEDPILSYVCTFRCLLRRRVQQRIQ